MINGWPQQADLLAAMHTLRPLDARQRKVMWRGRASDEPRDEVRFARSDFSGAVACLRAVAAMVPI